MRLCTWLALVGCAGAALGGACTRRVFSCLDADNCVSRGVQGVCEPTGFCSYPDSACDSGQRYDEFAGDGLTHECVPPPVASTDTASGDATASSGASTDTGCVATQCVDADGDGHGVGPDCAGTDCDDDNPAHFDACVYVSPDGDDAAAGTRDAPWLTFARALPTLSPGTSLVLLDGMYEPETTGMLLVDCGTDGNAMNGADTATIGVRAEHERVPELVGGGATAAVRLRNCGWWTLHGLRARGGDLRGSEDGVGDSPLAVLDSHDIVVRRPVVSHNNRYFNSVLIVVHASTDVRIEDAELYEFQRDGFFAYESERVQCRRCYANSRGYPDLRGCDPECADSELGCCTTDAYDTAFAAWESLVDSAFENCIVDGPIGEGFSIGNGSAGVAIRGSIVLDGATYGALIAGSTTGNSIEDLLVLGATAVGVYLRSTTDTQIRGATLLRSENAAFSADQNAAPLCADLAGGCSVTVERMHAQGSGGTGLAVSDQDPWSIESCNAFANSPDYSYPGDEDIADDAGNVRHSLSTDGNIGTAFGQCAVYIPSDSPLSGAAADGSDIGATILWRIEGVPTDVPLWDPETGAFPCGAVVPGLNDEPATSCIGAHTRLNVFGNGCARPPDYVAPPGECG